MPGRTGISDSMLIPFLFFCSGTTALIYEVVWSKYLALMFGSTIQAQTVVLAVFMGGLALGNRLFGGRADQANQPLAWYGYLEIAIGLYSFLFAAIYGLADAAFVSLGTPIIEHKELLLMLKFLFSVALLLPPTALMGGTLPMLAAWLQKSSLEPGRRSARFYSINSLGAVCGAGLAGFVLVQAMGLPATLQMTAFANVIVGFTAVGLARRRSKSSSEAFYSPTEATRAAQFQTDAAVFRWDCVMVTFTGAVSMGLEVLATRCLALIFGSSLQSFAVMLMAFILGIGVGSAVASSPRWRQLHKENAVVVILLATAALIGWLVFKMEGVVDVYRLLKTGLAPSPMGYRLHQVVSALIAIGVLGLPAALLGSVLPLSIRAASQNTTALGDRVGRLLTWNTMGAVGGVLVTGFVLMPVAGLRASFIIMAVALSLTALVVARTRSQAWASLAALGITGLLIWDGLSGGEGWRHVMSAGVFRNREIVVNPLEMEFRRKNVEILFYEDAADATVSVEKNKAWPNNFALRINGKPDASTETDLMTQTLLAHLPMMIKPDSKDVFMLGFGSGITGGALLGHPLEHLDIAENCEPVLRAGKLFEPWNHGVLTNARARIWREDARTVLKLNPQKYDIIISEPSNPWVAGIGSVFSREFYELTASRLKQDGIMVQWFHVYEMDDSIVRLVLRTFADVYPYVEIWDASDIIMLGSKLPWDMNEESIQKVFARPLPRQELERIGLKSPETIWARQLASQTTAFAIPGKGLVQSDSFPVLEYEAPKAFYVGAQSQLLADFDERTWQLPLALVQKRSLLSTLPDDLLKPIFEGQSTINLDLGRYFLKRFAGKDRTNAEEIIDHSFFPCIFRKENYQPDKEVLLEGASEQERGLAEACTMLWSSRDQWAEGVQLIEAILRNPAATKPISEGRLSSYAAFAAKASYSLGDFQRARELLSLGFKDNPNSDQLQYLARIMVRQKLLRPEELPGLF